MKWKEERALVSASGHDRSSRAHATPTLAVGEGKASPSRRAFSGWLKVPGPDPITSIHCRGLAAESMVGMRGSWVPCSQLHCGGHDSVSLHVSCGGRWRPLGVTPRAPPTGIKLVCKAIRSDTLLCSLVLFGSLHSRAYRGGFYGSSVALPIS